MVADAVEPLDAGALDDLQDTDLCEDCEEVLSDFFCNVCQCNLCADCWESQPAHRRKRLAPGQIPHEKTELLLANRVQNVFSYSGDERAFERLHKDDEITAWFGLEREMKDGRPFMFRDHGRFADLATSSHYSLFKQRRPAPSEASQDDMNCIPSLVSFVGQTGAGKSTLIKLLIQFNQVSGRDHGFPSPVPGINGRDIPTSEDVHLYADPLTKDSENPIMYADSEGLDGGEREPLAATLRKTREKRESESLGSESSYLPSRNYNEREVLWMTSKMKRTRQFAATQLYPRILFGFSDVVVFVHRNPRAIEGVLERLLEWGSVAIETTYNQPILPYAILALNATENDLDPHLWDVQTSTKLLFDSLATTVDKNVEFSKYAELWRQRGKRIDNVEDLMKCYYSAVRVVRLPTNGRPKLIEAQVQKLYLDIERGCRLARSVKAETRMLLNAFEFQGYLNHAFDHFCSTIDTPFDFVECSYLNTHLSTTFGESILTLAAGMARKKPRPTATSIFEKLGRMIASTIMLDTVRNNLKGTAERIFAQYVPQIDSALKEFSDRYWPCEFFVKGTLPAHLQAHLDNMSFQQSMRAAAVIMRCTNVRSGHAAKGHQLTDGRVFARGSYESSFSFENNRKQILDDIYITYHGLLEKIAQLHHQGYSRLEAASALHRDDILAAHYPPSNDGEPVGLRHTSFCICCLFGRPEASCEHGHMLCRNCLLAYGLKKSPTLVEVLECPLESHGTPEPRAIYLKPESAGVRVLALNNGGVRSVIQLEMLKLIEKQLNGKIPIRSFFDMVIGEGTGGVIALGLVARGWTLDDCEQHLLDTFHKTFTPANTQKFSGLMKASQSKYRSRTLDEILHNIFPKEQRIIGPSFSDHPIGQSTKAAVLTSSATGRKVLFSNYRRKLTSKLPYTLYPVTTYATEPRVWEIARASMAHPDLFKPFIDPRLGNLFFKKDMSENFLIEVAHTECQTLYPGLQRDFPDVVLSLGCGREERSSVPSIASDDTKRTKASMFSRLTAKSGEEKSVYSEDPGDAYAQYPRPNFISLNPLLDDIPVLDNVASIPKLQQLIHDQTDPEVITKLVSQLFATLFYGETDDPVRDTDAGEMLVPVRIYSRLLDQTDEIEEIGTLLKSGAYRNSEFVLWEEGYGAQQFPIAARTLDTMIREQRFPTLKLLLPLWQPQSVVHAVLRLENGEEYPLSGFPRSLSNANRNHVLNKRKEAGLKNPAWSAPSLPKQTEPRTWNSDLSLRSLSLNDTRVPPSPGVGLSGSPGPVEIGGQTRLYDDWDAESVTALPEYTQ